MFSRTDTVTDSERFYNSLLELLDDPEEKLEVEGLLTWWNRCVLSGGTIFSCLLIYFFDRQVFPSYSSAQQPVSKDSV